MPLPLGTLDTRTFDDLLEEARALLPRGAPSWTDHNYHDPGITLIELFAWLAESAFYRLDRTPDANIRAFLRIVGVEAHTAGVADTVLVFAGASASGHLLPASLQVGDAGKSVVFQTADPLFVSASSLVSVVSGADGALEDHTSDSAVGRGFPVLGRAPAAGSSLYLAFDRPFATAAATLSLYVWAHGVGVDRAESARIRDEYAAADADAIRDEPRAATRLRRDWRRHYSARTVWEYSSVGGTWTPLADVVDETRGLTLSGFVRAAAPLGCAPLTGATVPATLANRYVIRCRLTDGAHDCPPTVARVALNAVRARHERDVVEAGTGYRSTGRAAQAIELFATPVVPGSTTIRVVLGASDDGAWSEASTWDAVGPHDRAYVLEPEAGRIVFGDGRVGRVPPAAALIGVRYRTGGGPAGNIVMKTLNTALDGSHNDALVTGWAALRSSLTVAQPCDATGGAAAETLASAKARAVDLLTRPERAVTLADFEALALSVPGTTVARAAAIADYHPLHPGIAALGSVTVVVVPSCPDARPEPSDDLCAEVARYLCRRRPLTTEIHVVGPCYKQITVLARLHASAAVDVARLRQQSVEALETFFHPLRGGPRGTGWPIGRPLYRTEVMAVLSAVPGVTYVDDVRTQVNSDDAARCGNAEICPRGLVTSGAHQITIAQETGR